MGSLRALGLRLAIDKTKELGEHIETANKLVLRRIAEDIVDDAKLAVPVRTGYLKSTIGIQAETIDSVDVGATAPYAGFVEDGTSKMVARPYLRPAVQSQARNFGDLVVQEMERV